jgi:hypothetical protein
MSKQSRQDRLKEANERAAPYVGRRMKDGTIFAGVAPDTMRPVYAAAEDALCSQFSKAVQYAAALEVGGHQDFRVPRKSELNLLYYNKDKADFAGTFSSAGGDTGAWYWSSTKAFSENRYGRRFSDGHGERNGRHLGKDTSYVRPVREGEWPDEIIARDITEAHQQSVRSRARKVTLKQKS